METRRGDDAEKWGIEKDRCQLPVSGLKTSCRFPGARCRVNSRNLEDLKILFLSPASLGAAGLTEGENISCQFLVARCRVKAAPLKN
jgi:hypothetical protein